MRALIIFAFLLTTVPVAAQEHMGHFKRNPNGTDSISTPSGAYGESTADRVNNPVENPYKLSGDVPEDPSPNTPPPKKTSLDQENQGQVMLRPAGPAHIPNP